MISNSTYLVAKNLVQNKITPKFISTYTSNVKILPSQCSDLNYWENILVYLLNPNVYDLELTKKYQIAYDYFHLYKYNNSIFLENKKDKQVSMWMTKLTKSTAFALENKVNNICCLNNHCWFTLRHSVDSDNYKRLYITLISAPTELLEKVLLKNIDYIYFTGLRSTRPKYLENIRNLSTVECVTNLLKFFEFIAVEEVQAELDRYCKIINCFINVEDSHKIISVDSLDNLRQHLNSIGDYSYQMLMYKSLLEFIILYKTTEIDLHSQLKYRLATIQDMIQSVLDPLFIRDYIYNYKHTLW